MTIETLEYLFDNLVSTGIVDESEVIIIDNASRDDSVKKIKDFIACHQALSFQLKCNHKNVGFAAANNQGFESAKGEFILMYNSDILTTDSTDIAQLIHYLESNPQVGALTLRLELVNGKIDPASHRGFPTPWRALTYFLKLEKLLGKVPVIGKYFGGYHLTDKNLQKIHQVDAISGAFFLTRKVVLDRLGGFDERFFMYGEDLDLCFRLRGLGYEIIYYPLQTAIHLKHQSGLKNPDPLASSKIRFAFWEAMWLFYEKNLINSYPKILTNLIKKVIYHKANKTLIVK